VTKISEEQKLAVLVGPTASGKTEVSLQVAQLLNAEIISADSMQVYCGLDIGTAKVTPAQRGGTPHHLMDICEPGEDFSVADFRLMAAAAIHSIGERKHLPLLVGGTGLYVASLLNPYLFPLKTQKDDNFRANMRQLALEKGDLYLHRRLAKVDQAAAQRIHPSDHYRVVRALEVYEKTGFCISEIQNQSKMDFKPAYHVAIAGLTLRRELLYARIDSRVDKMIEAGFIDEVKNLLFSQIPAHSTALRGLGYRHLITYLKGLSTLDEALTALKRDTRRYAKRQYTWFKRDTRIQWFNVEEYFTDEKQLIAEELAREIAAYFKHKLEL